MDKLTYLVSIRYGHKYHSELFYDEKKARDYYTDMLVRYPDADVELISGRNKFDV